MIEIALHYTHINTYNYIHTNIYTHEIVPTKVHNENDDEKINLKNIYKVSNL